MTWGIKELRVNAAVIDAGTANRLLHFWFGVFLVNIPDDNSLDGVKLPTVCLEPHPGFALTNI